MKGKFKGWFSGLSMAGKIAAVSVGVVALTGGLGAVANPCNGAATYANKTETVNVPFSTVPTKDPTMNVGEVKVTKPGVEGQNQVTYHIGTKCNKQVSKDAIKTVVKTKPTDQYQLVGDKEVTTETQDVPVAFTNQNVNDSSMDKGTTKITQAGVNGTKTVTYQVTKIDGQEQSRTQTSETVTLQPVNQITHVGTYVAPVVSAPAGCYPLSNAGNCYNAGQYCRNADYGTTGIAGNGQRIKCTDRWAYY